MPLAASVPLFQKVPRKNRVPFSKRFHEKKPRSLYPNQRKEKNEKMRYVLASQSPRRREILENMGVVFRVIVAETDESSEERDPCRLVEILARRKGEAVWRAMEAAGESMEDVVIIASDTVVATEDEILGKPRDEEVAVRMLK